MSACKLVSPRGAAALLRLANLVPASEEEVPLVGFTFRSTVPSEAYLLGIISAELVAKKLPIWSTPRLRLSIHHR
jgi:hypothetical protein